MLESEPLRLFDIPEDRPVRTKTRHGRTFEARYNGTCYDCQGAIVRRQLIQTVWRGGVRFYRHAACG